jgi:hypothetical protein
MPGKSRHGKGKRYQYNKKRNIPRQDGIAAPTATTAVAAAATPKPAAAIPAAPAKKAAAASASAAAIANQYTYIPSDLKRIGILTGIIIVILFVLYFIIK